MTDVVVFSDDVFYSRGLAAILRRQGGSVHVCNRPCGIASISELPVRLYIVCISSSFFRQQVCQQLKNMKNVLHVFDMPVSDIRSFRFGYLSKRLTLQETWNSISQFLRGDYPVRIPLSVADITLVRTMVETEGRIWRVSQLLNITEKTVHSRKYQAMKKFGFDTTRQINLFYCHTLICFRNSIRSVKYDEQSIEGIDEQAPLFFVIEQYDEVSSKFQEENDISNVTTLGGMTGSFM
jgi:hypothetical protein